MSIDVAESTGANSTAQNSTRSNSGNKWLAVGAVALAATLAAAAVLMSRAGATLQSPAQQTVAVSRGDLMVTITKTGTLESSHNTEIKCQVRGGYGGRGGNSTVLSVIPPGSFVKKGDTLVTLDTKIIEETISLGKTDTNNAKAALARATADLAKAEIAANGYEQGRFRSQMQSLEKQLETAKWNLDSAQKMMASSEALFRKGYVTDLELKGLAYTVTQAELELNVKNTEIDVLKRLTKVMELETLNGQLDATKARLEGRKAGVSLEQSRLDQAIAEFERCTIRAPRGGLVIYPSTAKWKRTPDITPGASIHNNQVLLLMPDLNRMQVVIGIHESIVDRVQPGLPVKITLPNQVVETKIDSVASVATAGGWWTGNAVNYDATIRLPPESGFKPGMSADVEVQVAHHSNVLSTPLNSIVETENGHFCWVKTASGFERREVELGDSNDTSIVVNSGLREGELVALSPLDTIEDARDLVRPSLTVPAKPDAFTAILTEHGTLESSNNTVIKCRIRGTSTINWVIENGAEVEVGDELIRLENKLIEDYLYERTKFAHLSLDAAIGFRAEATRAGIAIQEYLEGQYLTSLMTLEKDLAIANERLNTAESLLAHTLAMADRGYVSELDVKQRRLAVTEATLEADNIRTNIDVLKRFTKEEQLETLRGNWAAAKAAANGHEEVLKMDETRMLLAKEEIARSVIRAETAGLVIYPTSEEWKNAPDIADGATVHNDQDLLLMPDLSQMQVKVGIHESMIDAVKAGMVAEVTLPNMQLTGEVVSVASTARPAAWWNGNMVKYDAIIKLPSVEGLKPGMSAQVDIQLARHQDAIVVPISAVVEENDETYCFVGSPDNPEKRSLQIGDTNDRSVVVESGVNEGELVIVDPTPYLQ